MAGNTAQLNTNKEALKLITRTHMYIATLPSPQTLNDSFRRKTTSHHTRSEVTNTTISSRQIITPLPFTQLITQEEDIMDANDNFEIPPQEFDTII